jgi:hypothetical protein
MVMYKTRMCYDLHHDIRFWSSSSSIRSRTRWHFLLLLQTCAAVLMLVTQSEATLTNPLYLDNFASSSIIATPSLLHSSDVVSTVVCDGGGGGD